MSDTRVFGVTRGARRWLAAVAAALAGVLAPAHAAESFPAKPLRIVVPFPAGGPQDLLGRAIAEALSARAGQPVLVDNRPGAGGNLGADVLAKAPADGYTLGILSGVHTANAGFYRHLRYDLDKDFQPLAVLGESAVLIVASNSAPFRDPAGLIAYAKAHPRKVNFGSSTSLTIDLLASLVGTEVTMVSYKGPSEAFQDLITGRIDLGAAPAPQLLPLVRDGKVRAIAVASTRRIAELPQVPTMAETVPGYDAGMWYGLFAPAGLPPEVARALRTWLDASLQDEALRARLSAAGVLAPSFTTAEIPHRIQVERARWRGVAQRTGNFAN